MLLHLASVPLLKLMSMSCNTLVELAVRPRHLFVLLLLCPRCCATDVVFLLLSSCRCVILCSCCVLMLWSSSCVPVLVFLFLCHCCVVALGKYVSVPKLASPEAREKTLFNCFRKICQFT